MFEVKNQVILVERMWGFVVFDVLFCVIEDIGGYIRAQCLES